MNTRFAVAMVLPLMILGCRLEKPTDSALEASRPVQEASRPVQLVHLACSYHVGYSSLIKRGGWNLALDADGRAKLSIDWDGPNVLSTNNRKTIDRTFLVDEERIADIEAAIDKYRFFELTAEVGGRMPDSGRRVLSIWTTNGQKTITIYFFAKSNFNEDARCAVQLWDVVRDCFDDEEAIDVRSREKRLLQQVFSGRLTDGKVEELNELRDKLGRSQKAESSGPELEE